MSCTSRTKKAGRDSPEHAPAQAGVIIKQTRSIHMDKHEEESSRNVGLLIAGFALGALAGTVLGLLFAPKSGKELRDEIKEKSGEYYDKAKEKGKEYYDKAKEKAGEAVVAGKDATDKAKEKIADAADKVKRAVETGVQSAREKFDAGSKE
jgi:gas vesicle protein